MGTNKVHALLISNTFISKSKLKLVKNQAKDKEQPEAERLLFNNKRYS